MNRAKITAAAALTLLMTSGVASANECDGNTAHSACITVQLGTILGSKTACGLKYDEDAIRAYIIDQINDDVSFASSLDSYAEVTRDVDVKAMSKGVLAAHCIIVRRFAEKNGFMK
jgi:hypothetical protein